jgi:hypothetical protein
MVPQEGKAIADIRKFIRRNGTIPIDQVRKDFPKEPFGFDQIVELFLSFDKTLITRELLQKDRENPVDKVYIIQRLFQKQLRVSIQEEHIPNYSDSRIDDKDRILKINMPMHVSYIGVISLLYWFFLRLFIVPVTSRIRLLLLPPFPDPPSDIPGGTEYIQWFGVSPVKTDCGGKTRNQYSRVYSSQLLPVLV